MNSEAFLDERRAAWRELEKLLLDLESARARRADPKALLRLAHLYRSACADLGLADAYALGEGVTRYVQNLVARAYGVIHRGPPPRWRAWGERLFRELPQRIWRERVFALSAALFFGSFGLAAASAALEAGAARDLVGEDLLERIEDMHRSRPGGRESAEAAAATGFYVQHNISIGLACFATGVFAGLGTLYCLVSNGILLGAVFGYMLQSPACGRFYDFVTAHAPFELSAIVAAGAAGLRLGFSLVATGGLSRRASLQSAARDSLPAVGLSATLFALAAAIEAYVSPSAAPYGIKVAVAAASAVLLGAFLLSGRLQGNRAAA